jgi:hypothetical protein
MTRMLEERSSKYGARSAPRAIPNASTSVPATSSICEK